MARPTDLVQGTLDLLILKTISLEPKHGWAIAKRIQQVSREALQVQQGSLYPALHRLEQQGWIKSEWRSTETGRMAKFYSLTRSGRRQFEKELASWTRLSAASNLVIQEVCARWTRSAYVSGRCSAAAV
jgi:transcriptional regulator